MATGRKKDSQGSSNDAIRSSDAQMGGNSKQPKKTYIKKT